MSGQVMLGQVKLGNIKIRRIPQQTLGNALFQNSTIGFSTLQALFLILNFYYLQALVRVWRCRPYSWFGKFVETVGSSQHSEMQALVSIQRCRLQYIVGFIHCFELLITVGLSQHLEVQALVSISRCRPWLDCELQALVHRRPTYWHPPNVVSLCSCSSFL